MAKGQFRSSATTQGRRMAGARALWRATGLKTEDFQKPIIESVDRDDWSGSAYPTVGGEPEPDPCTENHVITLTALSTDTLLADSIASGSPLPLELFDRAPATRKTCIQRPYFLLTLGILLRPKWVQFGTSPTHG